MRRKRSIVELFAAVPPVGAGKRKLDKEKLVAAGGLPKKRFKKEKAPVGAETTAVRKKEKSGNIKVTSLSISQLFQDAIQKRKLKKSPSKKKRNQEVSVLPNKKSMKGSKKSVLPDQKAIKNSCQVQIILKKHLRTEIGAFLKNKDVTCTPKSSCKLKHVTFSDVDGICGLTASQSKDNTEQSQLMQASQQPSQKGNSQIVNGQHNTEETQLVYQQSDAISGTAEEDTSSVPEKVGSSGISCAVPLTTSKERTILRNSIGVHHFIEMSNRGNRLNSMSSAAVSFQPLAQNLAGVDFHLQEGIYLDIGWQAEENHRMAPQGTPVPACLAVGTRPGHPMRTPFPQPSSSRYVGALKEAYDRNRSTVMHEKLVANGHLTEVHPSVLSSGKDMLSTISSTGSNKSTDPQTTDSVSACRNISASDDYIGLPVNSHGEFVRVQPGGTLNSKGVLKRQCSLEDSVYPSASPTFSTPNTSMDYAHSRVNHQALPFSTVANFGIQQGPHLTHTMPTAYGMGLRQFPISERMQLHNYPVPSNNSCSKQLGSSVQCFCSRCLRHDNQLQKSLEMQSCFPGQNYVQSIQPAVETTMRLMGRTVTLGTSSKQCGGLENNGPYSSKQIRVEDHYLPGTSTKVFPKLFCGGLVDPPSTFRMSNGERPPSEYASCFSSLPAAELGPGFDTNSFRTSNHSQQPQLAVPDTLFMQPVKRYNESGSGHQRPSVESQVQGTANHLQLGPVHHRRTPSVASMSSYDPKNNFKNFAEPRAGASEFSFFPQRSCNMTQRTPVSPFLSGYYSVQSSPALTTPTKFTSLRPLPPSMISSHVYSSENAEPHGSTPFHPAAPLSRRSEINNAPGDAILTGTKQTEQAPIGSNLESSKQINKSCKRPAENDDVLLTISKKPCIPVGKDVNMSPLPAEELGFGGSKPDGQPLYMPVRLGNRPEMNLRLVNGPAWSDPVDSVVARPVKLKPGAKHILQPCASASTDQEHSWPVHSVVQLAAENDAFTVGSSKKMDAESYRVQPLPEVNASLL